MELNIPAIRGIGGSLIYLVDRYGAGARSTTSTSSPSTASTPRPVNERRETFPSVTAFLPCMQAWAYSHRSHHAQRAPGPDGPLGAVLRAAFRFPRDPLFRHPRPEDRAALAGAREPLRQNPHPDQRADRRAARRSRSTCTRITAKAYSTSRSRRATSTRASRRCKTRGVQFMPTPHAYYEAVDARLPGHGEDLERLERDGILIDGEREKLLLQIFTETVIGPDFLRDHPAQRQRRFRRRQLPGAFRSDRARPDGAGGDLMRRWITLPRVEGEASRQAHADLPAGTYERELGKEGFYGPSTQMYHRHAPTAWTRFRRAAAPARFRYDTASPRATASPWDATLLLANAHLALRFWRDRRADGPPRAQQRRRRAHLRARRRGRALSAITAISRVQRRRLRGAAARHAVADRAPAPIAALLIEATNDSYGLPEKGIAGQHAVFDAAALDVPQIDDAFRAQQGETRMAGASSSAAARSARQTFPFNPLDAIGWHGTLMPVGSTGARSGRS